MKPSDIEPGKTYQNAGAGRTRRTVVSLVQKIECGYPVVYVCYRQPRRYPPLLSLDSFAKWAGKEVI